MLLGPGKAAIALTGDHTRAQKSRLKSNGCQEAPYYMA